MATLSHNVQTLLTINGGIGQETQLSRSRIFLQVLPRLSCLGVNLEILHRRKPGMSYQEDLWNSTSLC